MSWVQLQKTSISEEFLFKQYRLHALQRFYKKLKLPTVVDTAFERKITPKTSSFKNIFCLKFRNVLSLWRISRTVVFYTICFSWLVTFICLGHFKVYSIFIKKKSYSQEIIKVPSTSGYYLRILIPPPDCAWKIINHCEHTSMSHVFTVHSKIDQK